MTMKQKRRQQEQSAAYFFKVPNTAEGLAFLAAARRYAATGTRLTPRGRGPRALYSKRDHNGHARAYDQDLPRDCAEYFALYLHRRNFVMVEQTQWQNLCRRAYALPDPTRPVPATPEPEPVPPPLRHFRRLVLRPEKTAPE